MLGSRVLTGVENMASAFYVVYARERLGLPESAVGVFTIAIVAGGLIGVSLFGWLAMRFGSRRVIQAAGIMQAVAPLLACAVAVFGIPAPVAYPILVLVIGLNGAINRSMMLGYFQYAQDSAPEIDRPMYIGSVSAVAGTAALMPLVGGVFVDTLTRSGQVVIVYPLLFGVAALFALAGMWVSLKLPHPQAS
jgi:MFS family permease